MIVFVSLINEVGNSSSAVIGYHKSFEAPTENAT